MKRRTFFSALFAMAPAGAATRLQDSQVAAPVFSDTRVSVVLPNGTRAYATLDPATLALETVAGGPPQLKAIVPTPTASEAPHFIRAAFDKTANDGTFTLPTNGSTVVGVFRNGVLQNPEGDYEVVSASAIRLIGDQNWAPADTVLVMVA